MEQLASIAAFLLGLESAAGVGELSPLAAAAAGMAALSLAAIAAQVQGEGWGEGGGTKRQRCCVAARLGRSHREPTAAVRLLETRREGWRERERARESLRESERDNSAAETFNRHYSSFARLILTRDYGSELKTSALGIISAL